MRADNGNVQEWSTQMTKQNRPGSAVLVVVLVMSAAVLWCLNALKSFSLTMEMALKRQEREQKYRMTEGVLQYGLWLCKNRFATLEQLEKKGETTFVLDVGTWKLEGLPAYKGRLDVVVHGQMVDLKASLLERDACAFGMECQLEVITTKEQKKEKKQFIVRNWKTYV